MKPLKLTLLLGGFFILFSGSLALYFSIDENLVGLEENPQRRSESSIKANKFSKENREFEKSQITSKLDKIEDEPSALFNDPVIKQAWGLKKTDAARAWSVSQGSKDIVVAVIDTGIDIHHEDMIHNLWKNPGENGLDSNGKNKESNGVDDDSNGFVDDVYGWNFVGQNSQLTDNHGHGTHIAGIIGAEAGNGKGISGISPNVSLMILKYFDPKVSGTDNLKNTIAAIKYAVKMGAHIINYSGGGTEYSQEEHDAVLEAQKKGILFVAAAGNERSNSDQFHYYPADYHLDNIISVTAIDPSTEVLSSSNYGTETVDIAAPGQNILSCLPGNAYGYMTGTSQATAFVSGAAALVMARKHTYKAPEIKKYILATGDATTSLQAKTRTSRRLNLYKSLTILDDNVGANGVVVVNGQNLDNQFVNDPTLRKKTNTQSMSQFSKGLMDAVGKENKGKFKERLGQKPDSQ